MSRAVVAVTAHRWQEGPRGLEVAIPLGDGQALPLSLYITHARNLFEQKTSRVGNIPFILSRGFFGVVGPRWLLGRGFGAIWG